MKKLLFLLYLLTQYFNVFSDCIAKDIEVITPSDTISYNSKLIVNLFSSEFQNLIKNYPSQAEFLLSNDSKIYHLNIASISKGYNQIQLIIELPKNIIEGKYNFLIEPKNSSAREVLNTFLISPDKYSSRVLSSFFITNKKNQNELNFIWKKEPQLIQTVNEMYGCGPSVHNDYKIESNQTGKQFIYEVTLIDEDEKQMKAFLQLSRKGILEIGHGMCYGEFNLNPNTTYKVIVKPYLLKQNLYFKESKFLLNTSNRE